jgi:hypothetical protein
MSTPWIRINLTETRKPPLFTYKKIYWDKVYSRPFFNDQSQFKRITVAIAQGSEAPDKDPFINSISRLIIRAAFLTNFKDMPVNEAVRKCLNKRTLRKWTSNYAPKTKYLSLFQNLIHNLKVLSNEEVVEIFPSYLLADNHIWEQIHNLSFFRDQQQFDAICRIVAYALKKTSIEPLKAILLLFIKARNFTYVEVNVDRAVQKCFNDKELNKIEAKFPSTTTKQLLEALSVTLTYLNGKIREVNVPDKSIKRMSFDSYLTQTQAIFSRYSM